MNTYFITGGSGFLGSYMLKNLSQKGKILALIRSESLKKMSKNYPDVDWIEGDITHPQVCKNDVDLYRVLNKVTHIIHVAARYDLSSSHEDLYMANVVGTHNVIHLAEETKNLKAFHHFSTMAVAGNYNGLYTESMLDKGQTFPDNYASTKFLAESAVQEWRTKIPRVIYRLGILVGNSKNGAMPKIDGPYYLMRVLHRARAFKNVINRLGVVPLPFNEHTRLYMVPVDIAAKSIGSIIEDEELKGGVHVFHLMGEEKGIAIRTMLKSMLEAFGFNVKILALPQNSMTPRLIPHIKVPKEILFYMNSPCRYDMRRLTKRYPAIKFPSYEEYSKPMFRYAGERLFKEVRS